MNNAAFDFGKILVVAVSYCVAAHLSSYLAIPPGFASPVWPAAGIALAGILLWGPRIAVGVLLGSFLANLNISVNSGATLDSLTPYIISFIIATGATFQALFGSFLVRTFVSFPNRLTQEKDIFSILFWGGPMGCIISAIIGPLTLLFFGILEISSLLLNSFTWWIGDSIGAILFAPLIIMLFTPSISTLRKMVVAIPLLLFTSITVGTFLFVKDNKITDNILRFEEEARIITSQIEQANHDYLNLLTATESLIYASDYVSSDEFQTFTATFLNDYEEIYSLAWNPLIRHEDRQGFESRMNEEVDKNFAIKDLTNEGTLVTASTRETYLPIAHIAPFRNNIKILGYDAYHSESLHKIAIDKARDQGQMISTHRISLRDSQYKYGVVLYNPVYKKKSSAQYLTQKRNELTGYTSATLLIRDLMFPFYQMARDKGMHIVLSEKATSGKNKLLYDSRTYDKKEAHKKIIVDPYFLQKSFVIDFFGNPWEIQFIQNEHSLFKVEGWSLWYLLVGGLFISSIFGTFLFVVSAQAETTPKDLEYEADENHLPDKVLLIPILCFSLALSITLTFHFRLESEQQGKINQNIKQKLEVIHFSLQENVHNSLVALRRMAQRWEFDKGTPENEWREDAYNYVIDHPALKTVEWVDETYHVRYVEPLSPNKGALGLYIIYDEQRKKIIEEAVEGDKITLTPPLDLIQGYRAFISYAPLYYDNEFKGFIVGIFDLSNLLNAPTSSEINKYFHIKISDNGSLIYQNYETDTDNISKWTQSQQYDLFNRQWVIEITPNKQYLRLQQSYVPVLALITGIAVSVLIGSMMYYALISRERQRMLYHKTRLLEESDLKLRQSSERMGLILDNAGDGIYGLDLDGNTNFANQAALDMLGYTLNEMINVSQHDLIHHHYPDCSPYPRENCKIYNAMTMGEKYYEDSEVFWHKAGHSIPIEYTAAPIKNSLGEIEGVVVIFRDISERKETERYLLEAKENAEMTMRAKSEFLARMSHEIRTPMNGIIGTASLLESSELTEKQSKFVYTIKNSGESLLIILNEILDFSALESGKISISEQPFDVYHCCCQVYQLFEAPAKEKGLNFELIYDESLPDYIIGDEGRIRQVIINLVNNALKFTDRGSIIIEIQIIDAEATAPQIKFIVKDSGPGISRKKQNSLFQAFSQNDSSSVRKTGGTGLGLSISKGLVEMMDGSIGLDSIENIGTSFWFTIPLKIPSEQQLLENSNKIIEEKILLEDTHYDARILLVEDIAVNIFVVTEMLNEFGCTVDKAENGKIATEMYETGKYDLVFMDCQMPVMDGFEAASIIRAEDPNVPIVALTANVLFEEKDKCFESGMNGFVAKPITKEHLAQTLHKWLEDKATVMVTSHHHHDSKHEDISCDFVDFSTLDQFGANAQKVVEMTIKDSDQFIHDISLAIQENNHEDLKIAAHSLKSVVAQVGASSLSEKAKEIEHLANEKELDNIEDLTQELNIEYQRVKEVLNVYLDEN